MKDGATWGVSTAAAYDIVDSIGEEAGEKNTGLDHKCRDKWCSDEPVS